MNEPTRLRECGTEEVRGLLRHASRPRPMGAAEYSRVQRRVARLAAVPVAFGLLFWLKGLAMGAGIGIVVVAGAVVVEEIQVSHPAPSAPASAVVPPRPPRLMAPPPTSSALVDGGEPAPSVSAPARPVRDASGDAPNDAPDNASGESGVDSLAEEAMLVERARRALHSEPARALQLTREHATRFPRGQLGMERELVAIEALQKLGRGNEARARADALLRAAPGSLYEERIRNLLPDP